MIIKEASHIAMAVLAKLPDLAKSAGSDSLIEFSQPARVEMVCMVDERLMSTSYLPDLFQALNSICMGFYLQAFALSTTKINGVETVRTLDRLNPNRDLSRNAIDSLSRLVSTEAYQHALPVPGQAVGLEAFHTGIEADDNRVSGGTIGSAGKDATKMAQESVNLAVGKLFDIELEQSGKTIRLPISLRLMPIPTDSEVAKNTLLIGSKKTSAVERFHAWRSGQIEFVNDVVLMMDLIDEHKQNLIKDKNGIYTQTLERRKKNRLSAILTGDTSLATASSIVVIDDKTRKEVERELGGRLSDMRTREKVFKETYTMILVIVDQDYEEITFYYRSIAEPSTFSPRDLKSANKGSGPDVAEILRAYTQSNAPAL